MEYEAPKITRLEIDPQRPMLGRHPENMTPTERAEALLEEAEDLPVKSKLERIREALLELTEAQRRQDRAPRSFTEWVRSKITP
jgi:hypothetical protein